MYSFTYSLPATLRPEPGKKVNPSFVQLLDGIKGEVEEVEVSARAESGGAEEGFEARSAVECECQFGERTQKDVKSETKKC